VNYETDLKMMKRLVDGDPTNRAWKFDVIKSYSKVGKSLSAQDQNRHALDIYEEGLRTSEQITVEAPNSADWRSVAAFFEDICKTLKQVGDSEAALVRARQATEFFRSAAKNSPQQRDRLAQTLGNQAWYALLTGRYDEALNTTDEAVTLSPERLGLRINKIHALALSVGKEDARAFYIATRSLYGNGAPALDDQIEKDLVEFRSIGMDAADIEKISGLLKNDWYRGSEGTHP
jgi:tetratricopeptide (TPR) repeat protein